MIKVVILGAGNVAYHLAKTFKKSIDISVVQMYNRNLKSFKGFPKSITKTDNISKLADADVYIIAIADDFIAELSEKIEMKNKLIVHTSGSISIDELQAERKGVFYPLQSFSKQRRVSFNKIPLCLEASNSTDLDLLKKLANSITKKVYIINSEQRKSLHIAAVFVNNFVNHLYKIAEDICFDNKVPFGILKPLILETASKVKLLSPTETQTGPAKRNDIKVIDVHLVTLTKKGQKKIYKQLTKAILKDYANTKL